MTRINGVSLQTCDSRVGSLVRQINPDGRGSGPGRECAPESRLAAVFRLSSKYLDRGSFLHIRLPASEPQPRQSVDSVNGLEHRAHRAPRDHRRDRRWCCRLRRLSSTPQTDELASHRQGRVSQDCARPCIADVVRPEAPASAKFSDKPREPPALSQLRRENPRTEETTSFPRPVPQDCRLTATTRRRQQQPPPEP